MFALRATQPQFDIWHLPLVPYADLDPYDQMLDDIEIGRKQQFVFEKHQRRFATTRKLAKIILGAYLDCQPKQIIFKILNKGKPYLDGNPLHFNISHSGEYMAIGIHNKLSLGVDIECMQPRDFVGLANHSFSKMEIEQVLSVEPVDRALVFYRIWCQKEAFIKQNGQGLSYPLADFSVNSSDKGGIEWIKRDKADLYFAKHYVPHKHVQAAYCLKGADTPNIYDQNDFNSQLLQRF